jgi:hypothetical protein
MRRVIVGVSLLAACAPFEPPAPPSPRIATEVAASFGKTWDAVIDVFAEQNIAIRTMERASGFIAAEVSMVAGDSVAKENGHPYADCGKRGADLLMPTAAAYNVVVRGDSAKSTVRATVRFTNVSSTAECSTRGVWETAFEAGVRARATGEALPVAIAPVRATVPDSGSAIPQFVGDISRQIYYRIAPTCKAAEAISRFDRMFFKTEDDAKLAGMRRSLTQGC